jgi:repressor LexA
MNPYLTERQKKVLAIVRDHFLQFGYAPSLTELQEMLGINTKRGVVNHLNSLEKKGFIIRTSEPRGIQLVEEEEYEYMIAIPILGYANAGQPLAIAEEDRLGVIHVDKHLIPTTHELFSLVVKGDSMNQREIEGKKIEDGQYTIVARDLEYLDGDVVLAILDNSATIKTIKRDGKTVILYPESDNPNHTPIYLDQYSESLINGKVVRVLDNPSR